jgi:hypothetical protein
MNKIRKYVWKCQARANLTDEWKDQLSPQYIRVVGVEFNITSERPNIFRLRDGAPIPDEAFRVVAGAMPRIGFYIREILESKDDNGQPIVMVIREHDAIDPNKKIKLDNGKAFVICLYEDCGEEVEAAKASQHLREVHRIRFKTAKEIDHTNKKYFKLGYRHGD